METGNWVLAMTILAIYIPAISSRLYQFSSRLNSSRLNSSRLNSSRPDSRALTSRASTSRGRSAFFQTITGRVQTFRVKSNTARAARELQLVKWKEIRITKAMPAHGVPLHLT